MDKKLLIFICLLFLIGITYTFVKNNFRAQNTFTENIPRDADSKNGMKVEDIGLDDTCEDFVEKLLKVNPVYGWGWGGNKEEPVPPPPFEIVLDRLWWMDGKRRGGVGTIRTSGHRYDGWVVIFSTRHVGEFNFSDKVGHYNITITNCKIIEKDGWPVAESKVEGACYGFCLIEAKGDVKE